MNDQRPQNHSSTEDRGGWLAATGVAVGAGMLVIGVGLYITGRQAMTRFIMTIHSSTSSGVIIHPTTMPEFVRATQMLKFGMGIAAVGLVVALISSVGLMREE